MVDYIKIEVNISWKKSYDLENRIGDAILAATFAARKIRATITD